MSKRAHTIIILPAIAFSVFHAWRSGNTPSYPPGHQKKPACSGTAQANRQTAESFRELPGKNFDQGDGTAGSGLSFFGGCTWNEKAGVRRWTRHGPAGGQLGGWLRLGNTLYQ